MNKHISSFSNIAKTRIFFAALFGYVRDICTSPTYATLFLLPTGSNLIILFNCTIVIIPLSH
jgi:hypothetical protein